MRKNHVNIFNTKPSMVSQYNIGYYLFNSCGIIVILIWTLFCVLYCRRFRYTVAIRFAVITKFFATNMVTFIMMITRTSKIYAVMDRRFMDVKESCKLYVIQVAFVMCVPPLNRILVTHIAASYCILIQRIYIEVKLYVPIINCFPGVIIIFD